MTCHRLPNRLSKQGGFSLLSAIFLLLVLSGIATVMLQLSTVQSQGHALDLFSMRASQATETGLEWAKYHIYQQAAGVRWTTCPEGTASVVKTLSVDTLAGVLGSFNVQVSCVATEYEEIHNDFRWVYDLTVTATGMEGALPGSPNYVERIVEARVRQ